MRQSRRVLAGEVMAGDPLWWTLEEAAEMVRRKQVSPVELTEACLTRIEKLNPALNAFITVTADQARARARVLESEAQRGRLRGPLHGIPVGLKDLIDTGGVPTTAGSRQFTDRVPREDAEVVRLLKAAGAVIVGKLNMDEFAYNFTSETSCFGPSRNPWDTGRSPGGSSGGAAIAIASGMCYAALGSDTGGSIRLPAALCGITGMKPSLGLVSTAGVLPLAWSLDHVGPMCRSARDASLVLDVIAGAKGRRRAGRVRSVRFGIPRATYFDGLDPQVERAVLEAAKTFGNLGAAVREVTLPPLPPSPEIPELPLTYLRVLAAEAYAYHEEMLKRQPERYHPQTRESIEMGAGVSTPEYIRSVREIQRLRAGAERLFTQTELLITPSCPGPAFELGKPASLVFLRNLAPWNVYGLPSISIPCGFAAGQLPIGLQITGPPGRDDLVLAAAVGFQHATDWHTRRPPEGIRITP